MTASPLMIDASALETREMMARVVDALANGFVDLAAGHAQTKPRTLLETGPAPHAQLLVSVASLDEQAVACVKITSLTPSNPDNGLPLLNGVVVVVDLGTGQVRALLDGAALTALRTGAVAGLATRLCRGGKPMDLAMIGCGTQARSLLTAMRLTAPIRRVRVWSRTRTRAKDFAAWAGRVHGDIDIEICDRIDDAVRDASVVCTSTATDAGEPLVQAEWVRPGSHINVIGGTHSDVLEIDPGVLVDGFVVVEERDAALADAGEVRSGFAAGSLRSDDLHELATLVRGEVTPPAGATTVFRGVGMAIEDAAAAAAVVHAVSGA